MQYDPVRRKHYVRWREDGRQRIVRFDTPEEAEDFEQRRGGGTNPVDVQSPEVAALAARLAQLEAQTTTGRCLDAPTGSGSRSRARRRTALFGGVPLPPCSAAVARSERAGGRRRVVGWA